MKAGGQGRCGHRLVLLVVLAVAVVAVGASAAVAAEPRGPILAPAWNWAETSSYWNAYGQPITPMVWADPTGVRKGAVLEVEFEQYGWDFYVTNGPALFEFEHGKDYTLLFDVMETPECGHNGELRVGVVATPSTFHRVQDCIGCVSTAPDGAWHTVPVYITDFAGESGGYYLLLMDSLGQGCWMIGDIHVTSGNGHK